jgi:uncharacterized membrane protein
MSAVPDMFSALPNLHPVIVHLPLALFPVALFLDILHLALPRFRAAQGGAESLYVLGALGAGGAYWAGKVAASGFGLLSPSTQAAVANHSDSALIALWIIAVATGMRLMASWLARQEESKTSGILKVSALLVAVIGALFLIRTGDLGGALVYQHGLGVASAATAPTEQTAMPTSPTNPMHRDFDSESRVETELMHLEDGSILWQPGPAGGSNLFEELTVQPRDSVQVISPRSDSEPGITLMLSGPTLLALPGTFGDVQLEAEIELVDFNGSVGLVHHYQDLKTMGVFSLATSGVAQLRDLQKGEVNILDDQEIEVQDHLMIAVSASGRHLKGIVGDETVVHGHVPPGESGKAGLLLEGEGTLRIHSMTLRSLIEP